MPTRTTPRTGTRRTPSRPAATGGRFARPTPASGGRFARSTPATTRRSIRRQPVKRSKSDKALNGLAGLLPGSVLGRKAKPSASSGGGKGRTAGLALIAGAAGLALKNRDKLPGPLGRKTEEPLDYPPAPATPPAGAADPVSIAPDPLAPTAPERPNL